MTTHRERLLGQARADLTALPELCDELARILTERAADQVRAGKPGSRPPLRLDVLHLIDDRRKPGWWGEDPREPRWRLSWIGDGGKEHTHSQLFTTQDAAWDAWDQLSLEAQDTANIREFEAVDYLGVAPRLECWVRVLWFEIVELLELTETATVWSEASVLLEHWAWVEGADWGEKLADHINRTSQEVKQALGIRPLPRYRCPQCGNPADLVAGGILSCTEGHDRVVRDLEAQQRRRPPMTTAEIKAEYGVEPGTLRQWKLRRKITPVREEIGGTSWWLPWDVFCILNPDIAEAIKARDEVSVGADETA